MTRSAGARTVVSNRSLMSGYGMNGSSGDGDLMGDCATRWRQPIRSPCTRTMPCACRPGRCRPHSRFAPSTSGASWTPDSARGFKAARKEGAGSLLLMENPRGVANGPSGERRDDVPLTIAPRVGGEATLPPLPPRSPTACAPSPRPPGPPSGCRIPAGAAGTASACTRVPADCSSRPTPAAATGRVCGCGRWNCKTRPACRGTPAASSLDDLVRALEHRRRDARPK
jgi:hypothetical protein